MKVSVLIPAYNAARTVCASVESVLRQTVPPDEIVVYDDGSTDDTLSLLNCYKPRITVIVGKQNAGICIARNTLANRASGELISMIDADDVWHTNHLEVLCRLHSEYPKASLYFVGSESFSGFRDFEWGYHNPKSYEVAPELLESLTFFRRYNETPGIFYPSACAFPRRLLDELGDQPFVTAAEDAYFMYSAILTGMAVYLPVPLTAIRVIDGSLSSYRLRVYQGQVLAFELLQERYLKLASPELNRQFRKDSASTRRLYAKILMGAGDIAEARKELLKSLTDCSGPISIAKSTGLFAASYIPTSLQPRWPLPHRETLVAEQIANPQKPAEAHTRSR